MKKLLLLVVSLVMTVLLLYSQDYLLLYKQSQQNPKAIPINEIKSISHGDANIQTIVTNSGDIETHISEIDSLVFSSIHLCPDDNHPHIINLGLPSGTLWSCCNVGASSPEAYGGYYSWGETEEKDVYNEATYKYSTGVDTDGDGWYDDYHSDDDVYGIWQDLGDNIANTQYDVAHQKWGEDWRLPMYYDFEELVNHCTFQWTIVNGVNGGLFTSKTNGKSIFMPAAGYNWAGINDVTNNGYYWSSTPYPGKGFATYDLFFYSDSVTYLGWNNRSDGNSIRPVYDPWFFTPFSLSEDTVDVFVNSTVSVVIETGRGLYEIQNEHTDIMDAEVMMIDKEKYPDGKDEILIYGIAEGSTKLTVLNKKNNQTVTLVVNVKTPTENDVAITQNYVDSVMDFLSLQEEMPIDDYFNNLLVWLEKQNWVKIVNASTDNSIANTLSKSARRIKQKLDEGTSLITITFENGANFYINFVDKSFFQTEETVGNLDLPSYFEKDVSSEKNEDIIKNPNILYIQGRTMPNFDEQDESTAGIEDQYINQFKDLSPVNFKITPKFKDLSFLEDKMNIQDFGMILLGQTHGLQRYRGVFEVEDRLYTEKFVDRAITLFLDNGWVKKSKALDEKRFIYYVFPIAMKQLNISMGTIFYSCYCWSWDMHDELNQTTYFGYDTKEPIAKASLQMADFFNNMSKGDTYREAIKDMLKVYYTKFKYDFFKTRVIPRSNNSDSKQRYFSISTDDFFEYSDTGLPIIKGQINGYKNLKSDILYYAYVFSKDKELNYADITKEGKLINYEANDGKGINEDGTFSFEYSDLPIPLSSDYKVVVGFNYGGITYYGPIRTLKSLCPDSRHPHKIDLGLPSGTKWACCNVDSDPSKQSPFSYGGYYAWGEIEEKSWYGIENYLYGEVCILENGERSIGYEDIGNDIAGTEYDVAHRKWGTSWVMPSPEQIDELITYGSSEMTTVNGVYGAMVTGRNGCSIFLPAAGYRSNALCFPENGFYWASDPGDWIFQTGDYLRIGPSVYPLDFLYGSRPYGLSVRPVSP